MNCVGLPILTVVFCVRLIEKEADYVPEFYCVPHIEISNKIEKEDFATMWVGYGKVIRLNAEE